jgi:ubiquinone/menaquinone biosynthesis C-methylase UbiE
MAEQVQAESDQERLERERRHGLEILKTKESNWGWHTAAGRIRWERRLSYLKSLALGHDALVLEIGAGTGTFTAGLSETFRNLTAIDISPDLLQVAKAKAPHAQLLCMDAHSLEFASNHFDAIVGCSVLHHLDWTTALREFHRVLKPGGLIRFSEPNLLNPQIFLQKNIPFLKRFAGDSPDEYAFTGSQIRRALTDAGFIAISAEPYEFLHPSVPRWLINSVTSFESALLKTPLRHIAGSLMIEAWKGRSAGEAR